MKLVKMVAKILITVQVLNGIGRHYNIGIIYAEETIPVFPRTIISIGIG